MVNLAVWILFGGLAGWIISLLFSSNNREATIRCIIVGGIGACIGGVVVQVIKGDPLTQFSDISILPAVLTALLLIGALQRFTT